MADEIQLIVSSLSVAVPILLGIGLYMLNEKSKRAEFEREKKYGRKLEAFQTALSSLHMMQTTMTSQGWIFHPEKTFEEIFDGISIAESGIDLKTLRMIGAFIASTEMDDNFDFMSTAGELLKELDVASESNTAFKTQLLTLIIRNRRAANRDFEKALSTLRLLDVDVKLLFAMDKLMRNLLLRREKDIELKIKEIEEWMLTDLQNTIKKPTKKILPPSRIGS
jgi:hypothetical protein